MSPAAVASPPPQFFGENPGYLRSDLYTALRMSEAPRWRVEKALKKLDDRYLVPFDEMPELLRWNVCRAKLARGCWDWKGWELRSDWGKMCRHELVMPMWEGSGELLVVGEEGVGDEVMAASCFGELPDCTIETDARLIDVFARSFPRHRFVPRMHDWKERKKVGSHFLPMLDLFPMFRPSPASCPGVPYLKADPERVEYWKDLVPAKIGVAWSSRHGKQRPFPVEGVSLQYGEDPPDWIWESPIDPVKDFGEQINLIAALDEVISGPMSVVHVAGALGIKTSVVMPAYGSGKVHNTLHWRYMTGLPFYQSATVYQNWQEYRRA